MQICTGRTAKRLVLLTNPQEDLSYTDDMCRSCFKTGDCTDLHCIRSVSDGAQLMHTVNSIP